MGGTLDLGCATWNVHRARGADGRVDPARVLRALREEVAPLGPDILALQEADEVAPPGRGLLDPAEVEAATGLRHAQGDARLRTGPESHGFQGSVLYLAPRLVVREAAVLDLPGHWPRGAVVAEAEAEGVAFRVAALHLSRPQLLRIAQLRTLGQFLARRPPRPLVLLGDLNEWRPWGGLALSARVAGRRLSGPAVRTFPAMLPLLPLDRVLCDAPGAVRGARALDGPLARSASDHRPLWARVVLPPGPWP